jgi:hypothetical protein
MQLFEKLNAKSTVLILAYAPAGLGHLRVTNALYHGLPPDINPILMGAEDTSITTIHRITSVNKPLKKLMEWVQHGYQEIGFTYIYRNYLRSNSDPLYRQIQALLKQRLEVPKTIIFVASHFGLAHQLAAIKEKLARSTKTKIILAVIVTDDSPQCIWAVPNADIIFTPSFTTAKKLLIYSQKNHWQNSNYCVIPYPISPQLNPISTQIFNDRLQQLQLDSNQPIEITVPISGAATGTNYCLKIMELLHQKSNRFKFHVVVKNDPQTREFINLIEPKNYIKIYTSSHNRKVVEFYESIYLNNSILFEITKPSEQAFKAMFNPNQIGGSILLFSKPVGRQEWDNLDFLTRHFLIPDSEEKNNLENSFAANSTNIPDNAKYWRGIRLSEDLNISAEYILWGIKSGLFIKMLNYERYNYSSQCNSEISSGGVLKIWGKILNLVPQN